MKKEKNHKELEGEKRHGRKRYIERIAEDDEAQQLIQDFLNNPIEESEEREDSQPLRPFS
jgi:hypothetical protein